MCIFQRYEDNIPLRVMLLLMDEVFDLKNSGNQWIRHRIAILLRQIAKTMFGDSMNRSDYLSYFMDHIVILSYLMDHIIILSCLMDHIIILSYLMDHIIILSYLIDHIIILSDLTDHIIILS